jgi:hypothetical protein
VNLERREAALRRHREAANRDGDDGRDGVDDVEAAAPAALDGPGRFLRVGRPGPVVEDVVARNLDALAVEHEDAADRLAEVGAVVGDEVVAHGEVVNVRKRDAAVAHRVDHRLGDVLKLPAEVEADLVRVDEQAVDADELVQLAEREEARDADAVEAHVVNFVADDFDVVEVAGRDGARRVVLGVGDGVVAGPAGEAWVAPGRGLLGNRVAAGRDGDEAAELDADADAARDEVVEHADALAPAAQLQPADGRLGRADERGVELAHHVEAGEALVAVGDDDLVLLDQPVVTDEEDGREGRRHVLHLDAAAADGGEVTDLGLDGAARRGADEQVFERDVHERRLALLLDDEYFERAAFEQDADAYLVRLDGERKDFDVLRLDDAEDGVGRGVAHARRRDDAAARAAAFDGDVAPVLDEHVLLVESGQHADLPARRRQCVDGRLDAREVTVRAHAVADAVGAAGRELRQRLEDAAAVFDLGDGRVHPFEDAERHTVIVDALGRPVVDERRLVVYLAGADGERPVVACDVVGSGRRVELEHDAVL